MDPALRAFEEHRREFIETMRELRRKNPHMEPEELQKQVENKFEKIVNLFLF